MSKKRKSTFPSYTQEAADEVIERMCGGESLTQICKSPHLPGVSTVFYWSNNHEEFRERYVKARETLAEYWAYQVIDISDGEFKDVPLLNAKLANRDRLRVDTRKFLLSKIIPKVYGERITQEHVGKDGAELKAGVLAPTITTLDEWRKLVDQSSGGKNEN